jgi:hypothetical protein
MGRAGDGHRQQNLADGIEHRRGDGGERDLIVIGQAMQRQDHLLALAQGLRHPLLGRVVAGLGPQPADGVPHGGRAERGHGDAEATLAHLRELAPVQAGHRGAQRGPVQPRGDRGVVGPGHEYRAERGDQR